MVIHAHQLVALLAGLVLVSVSFGEDREWSRGEGKEPVTAAFAGLDKATKSVVLMMPDGAEAKVPFAKLSTEDKAYVSKMSKALTTEAKRRKVPQEVSEIFFAQGFNTTFVATRCIPIGTKSKLKGVFYVMGDVKDRGGKATSDLKATLSLVRFLDVAADGGTARIPLYRASNVRPAPAKNVRDARKGR